MQPLKTYLVEDSAVIRQSLVDTLEELTPVQVVGMAEDETTATRWLALPEHEAELVIVDIFLKTGSGLGVLASLAASTVERKSVVLSNYVSPDLRRKCLALGADRVFDKSTEIDALIAYCTRVACGEDSSHAPLS